MYEETDRVMLGQVDVGSYVTMSLLSKTAMRRRCENVVVVRLTVLSLHIHGS
jgi:hypothetical protein